MILPTGLSPIQLQQRLEEVRTRLLVFGTAELMRKEAELCGALAVVRYQQGDDKALADLLRDMPTVRR
jgi:hypothetical protein